LGNPDNTTYYVDGGNGFSLIAYQSGGYYDVEVLQIQTITYYSFVVDIEPGPCYLYNDSFPSNNPHVYYGTVSLDSFQKFDLYGSIYDGSFYAFDSMTEDLMAIYNGASEQWIYDWNPRSPPQYVFSIPGICYQIPLSGNPDPSAPTFPSAFTMTLSIGQQVATLYYNGPNQMWRVDTQGSTMIQLSNMQYYSLESNNMTQNISPLPCNYRSTSYFFPYFIPTYFVQNMGTAIFNGETLNLWGFPGGIWYFDQNNNPVFSLLQGYFITINSLQVGPPPSSVFQVPAFCLYTPNSSQRSNMASEFTQIFSRKE